MSDPKSGLAFAESLPGILANGARKANRLRGTVPFPIAILGFIVLSAAIPLYGDDYVTTVAISVLTFALLGVGLNIVLGFAGLFDLGYSAFFAIGAYTTAVMTVLWHIDFWLTVPPAMLLAGAAGAVIGYPTLRLRSDYLAIVTLGFGEIVRIIFLNWDYVGGPRGLYGIPAPHILGYEFVDVSSFYVLGVALVAVALLLAHNLVNSYLGRSWRAIRDDEFAAEASGVPTVNRKLLAYTIGGMIGGLGGAFFATRLSAIDPSSFTFILSSQVVILIIIGGRGSLPGVLLGATLLVAAPEFFRFVQTDRFLIFGFLVVLVMLFRPQGVWPASRARVTIPPPQLSVAAPLGDGLFTRRTSNVAPGEAILRVDNLSKNFGGVRAVDDVNLAVTRGEIFSIIGPNGAGKTTVFNCISGVQKGFSGRIEFDGRSVSRIPPHALVRRGVARTFQGIRLFKTMTVLENVMIGASTHEWAWPWQVIVRSPAGVRHERRALAEAIYWLQFVSLDGQGNKLARELSYADQRRVEIARALACDPFLVLLDEPAAGMNPTEKLELMTMVRRIRDRGVTVVLIEHDMSVVMNVSDRVAVLDLGKKIAEGKPQDIQNDPRVVDAYLGKQDGEMAPDSVRLGIDA